MLVDTTTLIYNKACGVDSTDTNLTDEQKAEAKTTNAANFVATAAGNVAVDANYIICANGGSVDLYHNNAKKLETESGGVNITGIIKENSIPTRSRSIAMAMTWG